MVKQPKPKKCKVCKILFTPDRPLQQVCNYQCAIDLANRKKLVLERVKTCQNRREAKERLKTRSDWMREAQSAFNAFIRERDKHLPCISCGRWHDGQYHAGHYRTVGSCPELRFVEENNHKQCAPCNNHLSGNLINYRRNLIIKIGLEKVEWLEGQHPPLKLTIDDIKAIKAKYKELLKLIKNT